MQLCSSLLTQCLWVHVTYRVMLLLPGPCSPLLIIRSKYNFLNIFINTDWGIRLCILPSSRFAVFRRLGSSCGSLADINWKELKSSCVKDGKPCFKVSEWEKCDFRWTTTCDMLRFVFIYWTLNQNKWVKSWADSDSVACKTTFKGSKLK